MELITFEKFKSMCNCPLVVTIGAFDGIHLALENVFSIKTL